MGDGKLKIQNCKRKEKKRKEKRNQVFLSRASDKSSLEAKHIFGKDGGKGRER